MRTRLAALALAAALGLLAAAPRGRAAVGPPGAKAYVTNAGSDSVSVIDLTDMSTITTIDVGDGPRGPAATPDGAFVYVADQFGTILNGLITEPTVTVISTANDAVVDVIPLTGLQPHDCAVTPNGLFVYVVCNSSDTVSVISTATNTEIASIQLATGDGDSKGIAITPDGTKVYVGDPCSNDVEVIATATNTLVGSPIPVNNDLFALRVSSDGTKVIVVGDSAPVIIRTSDDTVIPTAFDDIGDQTGVAISGNLAYVSNRRYQPPQVEAKPSKTKSAAVPFRGSLDIYDLAAETYIESIEVFGEEPVAVDLLRDGTCAYVATDGEGTSLQSIDLTTRDDVDNGADLASGPSGVAVVQPRPIVDSFFLPKKVAYKKNAAAASQSVFKANGFFDTGSGVVVLTDGATLTVGTRPFVIPSLTAAPNGRKFTYSQGGLTLVVVKNPFGSSRAKFRLTFVGDLGTDVPTEGNLDLRFQNDAVDGFCTVLLANGGFRLGKKRGALSQPNLFVVRAAADVPGNGRDTLSLIVGLATGGTTPETPSEVRVQFGDGLNATIPAAEFERKGDTYVFKGDIGGVTDVTVDYVRETVSIQGKNLSLGTFAAGQTPLQIFVGVGAEDRGVAVRVARQGNVLKY